MWKKELIKNKLYSLLMTTLGAVSIPVENDITLFIFMLMFSIPLFFAKKNYIR